VSTRASLLVLALATACGGRAAPAPTIGNTAAQEPPPFAATGLRDGALWTCQIDDYDPQPCKLSRDDNGGWRLAKLLGSQRFRGAVIFREGGARFLGEYFCPWGDCTQTIDVDFTQTDDGAYVGQARSDGDIQPPALRVQYDAANAEAFGGAGYGGLSGDEQ